MIMTSKAFIWDLDGTLTDSYSCIVPAVKAFLEEFGVRYPEDYIRQTALLASVGELLSQAAPQAGKDPVWLKEQYEIRNDIYIEGIRPMPGAEKLLKKLTEAGHQCFVYTHRGTSCHTILKNTGLLPYFTEVVTSLAGFPKKPRPDGIFYLMEKYGLDRDNSYYVGDRILDVHAGNNAGINSVLYLPEGSPVRPDGTETCVIRDLMELLS